MRERVLDIFYNWIIKEVKNGRVNALRYYNLVFNTKVNGEDIITTEYDKEYNEVIVPTLNIYNKELFDNLLVEYVIKAISFYDKNSFQDEVMNGEEVYDEGIKVNREKEVICSLFANATVEDFYDPINFLRNRIEMFDRKIIDNDEIDLGYSELFKGRFVVQQLKEKMCHESPYVLKVKLVNDELDHEYYFPDIRIGITDKNAIFYAIQREDENKDKNEYFKYVSRLLHKIDKGIDVNNDTFENYGEGNLKDITSSFLVSSLIGTCLCNSDKIDVSSLLISRWNAKRIAIYYKKNRSNDLVEYEENLKVQDNIQNHLSEKFLRLFRRLDYQVEGIDIISYPFDVDSFLKIKKSQELHSDNELINEIINLCKKNKDKEITF